MGSEQTDRWSQLSSAHWRRLAAWGATHAPELFVRYAPPVIGAACALGIPEARERVRDNLRRACGRRSGGEEWIDVFRTFSAYAHCLTHSLGERAADVAVVRGRNHLIDAAKRGGAVIGTAHLGAWDAIARMAARDFGWPITVVMGVEPDETAAQFHDEKRARGGARVAHSGQGLAGAFDLLKRLRRGEVVALQVDRVGGGRRSVSVPFLDGELTVPEGPFRLASLAGVPFFLVIGRRLGHGKVEVRVSEPVVLPYPLSRARLVEAAQQTAGEVERFVRAYPTQWFHFERAQARQGPESLAVSK